MFLRFITAAFISVGIVAHAQETPQSFAQCFYSWYAPLAIKDHQGPAFEIALKRKASLFSAELAGALRQDADAQRKARGEIVGIDFDPFLFSQDPKKHYEARRPEQKGNSYFVPIHAVRPGKPLGKPDVVAELTRLNGHWVFVDFHSPSGIGLLATLKTLAQSRK